MNTNQSTNTSSLLFSIMITLAMLSWGGSWISARWASSGNAEATAFWRFLINGLSFIPILLVRRDSFALTRKALPWILLSAATLAVYNIFFLNAMKSGEAGYGGVLVPSLNPQFAFLIALVFFGQKAKKLALIGLACGLFGGLIQMLGPNFELTRLLRSENILLLTAAAIYALLTHLSARAQKEVHVLRYSFWVALFASLFMLPLAWHTKPWLVSNFTGGFWFNVLYLALAAGTFGTTLYFEAARRIGAARASGYAFLVPVSALVLGFLILGEIPAWTSIVGGCLSLGAVVLIQLAGKSTQESNKNP